MKPLAKEHRAYIRLLDTSSEALVCTESFWTEPTQGGYRIANIPYLATAVHYGDVVQIDENSGEILSVVQRSQYRTGLIHYVKTANQTIERSFIRVSKKLARSAILVEGVEAGIASIAIPKEQVPNFWSILERIPEIIAAEIYQEVDT